MSGPASPLRVLIADDDFLVTEAVAGLLRQLGHECVATASTGDEALQRACALRPDLAILDIEMPGKTGIEVGAALHERCPLPVVILSAYDSPQLAQASAEAHVGAYLTKPPRLAELVRALAIAKARFDDLERLRRLSEELARKNDELAAALGEVRTLRGLIPICAWCKDVRDDGGYWKRVEVYVREHTHAKFTHGMCPACAKKLHGSEE